MTFFEHFFRLLRHRPKPALIALYWHLTRRRVRARNCLNVASADLQFAYEIWIAANEPPIKALREYRALTEGSTLGPRFAVLLYSLSQSTDAELRRSIESLERQVYPGWKLTEVDKLTGEALRTIEEEFVVPLAAGDVLSPWALLHFAAAAEASPPAQIMYGDEDRIDGTGARTSPWFKPDWNEELFLSHDYLSRAVAIESRLAKKAASEVSGSLSELLLKTTSAASKVIHIPHILVHVPGTNAGFPSRIEAVAHHVGRQGGACRPGPFGTAKVEWPLPEVLPQVTIIIPTKDKVRLLRACVQSVLQRTSYGAFEILIVDNGSVEQETRDYLRMASADPRIRVVSYTGPYNFSAINNWAARQASGSFLCLLNNDTEVIEREWLTELMRYAVKPDVGAVGAKLLYDDFTIQHAGVVVGIGDAAGHAHRFLPANDPGYFHLPHVTQFVSAVTAACLVIEKSKFEAVGGLDENLAVAFNDVDFCMKIQAAGWRNVYVPHAVLLHHESSTRGSDMKPGQLDRYLRELQILQERWQTKTYQDPLHNPNLNRASETFVLRI